MVPFQVSLEVNVVLVGLTGDGGYRYSIDSHKLEEFLRVSFSSHRPSCLETCEPLDIEHHIVYNVFPEQAGQPELIELEKALKAAMVPAGTSREVGPEHRFLRVKVVTRSIPRCDSRGIFGCSKPLPSEWEIEAKTDFGREVPAFEVDAMAVEPVFHRLYSYIFNMESGRYSGEEMDRPVPSAIFIVNFDKLTEEEMKKEGDYVYRYHYNGGGASQVWLSSGRFVVIDLSAGPCTCGKIETEEGSVSSKTLPRLRNVMFPRGLSVASDHSAHDIFVGQVAALVATTIEHVIAPDVRPTIEAEVKKMVHTGQEVVMIGGMHALHRHEKLAIALSKAMRSHSLQETKTDGRFHVHTRTYLDGAILKEEMERSADVLAPAWMTEEKKQKGLYQTYGTRIIPVFVLSLADVDPRLMMEDDSLVWTSNDVVIVLEHQNEKIPLSNVSETERRHAIPSQAQRHILAGLASVVSGLSAPYEKASHIHERPLVKRRYDPDTWHLDLSSLLYDHRLQDAHLNSSEILQSSIFTQQKWRISTEENQAHVFLTCLAGTGVIALNLGRYSEKREEDVYREKSGAKKRREDILLKKLATRVRCSKDDQPTKERVMTKNYVE
ncbi:unnamed protein product [Camellia sinensis]